MSQDDDEYMVFEAIGQAINDALGAADCRNVHFAFVVWCDCVERPFCAFTNDDDKRRVAFMLNDAGERLSTTDLATMDMEGHA